MQKGRVAKMMKRNSFSVIFAILRRKTAYFVELRVTMTLNGIYAS